MSIMKKEFSKALLVWETILIWVVTLGFLGLAYICIINQYHGELAWLGAIYAFPWTAYGVSQACYYNKAKKENTVGGIKYDTIMHELTSNTTNSGELIEDESKDPENLTTE